MTYAIDPVLVMMELVKLSEGFSSLAAGRVWGAELPEAEQDTMPRAQIVIAASGVGASPPGVHDHTRLAVTRIDVRSYGTDPFDAAVLSATLDRHLHAARRQTLSAMVVYWCKRVAGPITYRAAPGDWPVCVRTYEMMHATSLVE